MGFIQVFHYTNYREQDTANRSDCNEKEKKAAHTPSLCDAFRLNSFYARKKKPHVYVKSIHDCVARLTTHQFSRFVRVYVDILMKTCTLSHQLRRLTQHLENAICR